MLLLSRLLEPAQQLVQYAAPDSPPGESATSKQSGKDDISTKSCKAKCAGNAYRRLSFGRLVFQLFELRVDSVKLPLNKF